MLRLLLGVLALALIAPSIVQHDTFAVSAQAPGLADDAAIHALESSA